jgi:hypothetical protein
MKKRIVLAILSFGCVATGWCEARAQEVKLVVPKIKTTQMLVSHEEVTKNPYLSFPCVARVSNHEVLITFKRGSGHGDDREADCDLLRFNTVSNQIVEHKTLGSIAGRKFQLTVPVKIAENDWRFYTDLQEQGWDNKNYRSGMHFTSSKDAGNSVAPWALVGLVEGVEYGYPLDFIVEGKTVYMLAMSFGYQIGRLWSVAVLKSVDGAKSWKKIQSISEALGGGPINESCFVRVGADFVVVSRGYVGQETKIARFDKDFKLQQVAELTGPGKPLQGYIGWPRIYNENNQLYVIGRIRTQLVAGEKLLAPKNMRLGLLKINPKSLDLKQIAFLDNEDGSEEVADGYYAGVYWQKIEGETWFNAVTYRSKGKNPPDIIRYAFRWDEVR